MSPLRLCRRTLPRGKRWVVLGGSVFFVGALGLFGRAFAGPLLHERFADNPEEDLAFEATTRSGGLPSALRTNSGLVTAPSRDAEASSARTSYGGSHTPDSPDASFSLDRQTTSPSEVDYHEPFRPSILPFKRLYAFDVMNPDGSLGVFDTSLRRLPTEGSVRPTEDEFYGDITVELVAGTPVRIPSVGPHARMVGLEVEPPIPVELLRDGAENWFLRSERTARARALFEVVMTRKALQPAAISSALDALGRGLPPLPERAQMVARDVLAELSLLSVTSPQVALEKLVHHFRGFRESDELPVATEPLALYAEITRSKKGVCRHRAFAFFVTARALGFPVRFVHNEAHAWVEVSDGELFHRIDLGGAAAHLRDDGLDPSVPNFQPPGDPFLWPSGSIPGANPALPPSQSPAGWPMAQAPEAGNTKVLPGPTAKELTRLAEHQKEYVLSLELGTGELQRGADVPVRGQAKHRGRACVGARIDVVLEQGGKKTTVGSLPTSKTGSFEGTVTLPRETPVGEASLFVQLAEGCVPLTP